MDVAVVVAVVETTKVETLEVFFFFFARCVSFLVVSRFSRCLFFACDATCPLPGQSSAHYRLLSILRRKRSFGFFIWQRYITREDALLRCFAAVTALELCGRPCAGSSKSNHFCAALCDRPNVVRLQLQLRPRCLLPRPNGA